jgi:predicted nucleic acid-binding protein
MTTMAKHRPLVFLDTNVVLRHLDGQLPWLFDQTHVERFRYAINPVVLQEVILGADRKHPDLLERVRRIDMLPIDIQAADAILSRAKEIRNRVVHSNDILIFSSAAKCDYLLTSDKSISALQTRDGPKILTPEEFRKDIENPE